MTEPSPRCLCGHVKEAHFSCEIGSFCNECPKDNHIWEHVFQPSVSGGAPPTSLQIELAAGTCRSVDALYGDTQEAATPAPPQSATDYPAILERERTLVAEGVTAIKKAIECREWLTEGRGSYEWDDDRWHGEFAAAIREILAALTPLEKVAADWSNCPKTWEEVQRARAASERAPEPTERQYLQNILDGLMQVESETSCPICRPSPDNRHESECPVLAAERYIGASQPTEEKP